jgi:hypothetical protein
MVLGAALVVYSLYAAYLYRFTPDDVFIYLRYANNWAGGGGPVFNPGVHEQGYTSFLWVAILTAARAAGIGGLAFAKGTGAVLGGLLVVLTQVLGLRLQHQRAFQVFGRRMRRASSTRDTRFASRYRFVAEGRENPYLLFERREP